MRISPDLNKLICFIPEKWALVGPSLIGDSATLIPNWADQPPL